MQIVAALTKTFVPRIATLWWHHHIPWYIQESKDFLHQLIHMNFWKGLFERIFIIPQIDQMIATSYFIAEKVQEYCGRESKVIHPIIEENYHHFSYTPSGIDQISLFTHGRLEAGKGLDMIVRVLERIQSETQYKNISLLVF